MFLTELERSAEQGWASLLAQADLPQQGWSLKQLSKRDDGDSARIAYRATHADGFCYTYKHQLRPQKSETFQRQFDSHKAVFETFPGSSEHQVPKPIWMDAETQSCLFSYLDGEPLAEPMLRAMGDLPTQMGLLKRAGASGWIHSIGRMWMSGAFSSRNTLCDTCENFGPRLKQVGERSPPNVCS